MPGPRPEQVRLRIRAVGQSFRTQLHDRAEPGLRGHEPARGENGCGRPKRGPNDLKKAFRRWFSSCSDAFQAQIEGIMSPGHSQQPFGSAVQAQKFEKELFGLCSGHDSEARGL